MKRLNDITPRLGMVLSVYLSTKQLGSGAKRMAVIGLSGYYITLFYAQRLQAVRVKRCDWGNTPAIDPNVNSKEYALDISNAVAWHNLHGKRYNRSNTERALAVLGAA